MSVITHLIHGRVADLGGFQVQRLLPAAAVPMVGPFIFADHMGPAQFAAGAGIDVRPHPHIGLATVTYLLDGEFIHRDSLGTEQRIVPGDVNWMTAGRGIVHSERTPVELRAKPSRAHGMQTWVALPEAFEDAPPAFEHHAAKALPQIDLPGVTVRVIAGNAFGRCSPVGVFSPTLYCLVTLRTDGCIVVPAEHEQRAVYVLEGAVDAEKQRIEAGSLAVLAPAVDVAIEAAAASRLMLLGGAPVGQRFIWWNLVASSRARIDEARREWARYGDASARGRFGTVPGETEFIPLPER